MTSNERSRNRRRIVRRALVLALLAVCVAGAYLVGWHWDRVTSLWRKPSAASGERAFEDYAEMLEYLDVKFNRQRVKPELPTKGEIAPFPALWPAVPLRENAAFYYAMAIHECKQDGASPGTASNGYAYDGNAAAFAQWIKDNQKALALIRKALQFRVCQFPPFVDATTRLPREVPESVLMIRDLEWLACDAGRYAEIQAKWDEAADWYLACMKMGEQFGGDGTLMQYQLGIGIHHTGERSLAALIATQPLSESTLRRVQAELGDEAWFVAALPNVLRKHAAFVAWTLWDWEAWRAQVRQEKEGLDARDRRAPSVVGGWDYGAQLKSATKRLSMSREEFARYRQRHYEAILQFADRARQPLAEWAMSDAERVQFFARLKSDPGEPGPTGGWRLAEALWSMQDTPWIKTSLDALKVRVAIALYEKKHGKVPEKLADLVPDCLSAVPIDPYDFQPYRYKKDGKNKWRVYSVGKNRKDDGGTRPVIGSTWRDAPDMVFQSVCVPNLYRESPHAEMVVLPEFAQAPAIEKRYAAQLARLREYALDEHKLKAREADNNAALFSPPEVLKAEVRGRSGPDAISFPGVAVFDRMPAGYTVQHLYAAPNPREGSVTYVDQAYKMITKRTATRTESWVDQKAPVITVLSHSAFVQSDGKTMEYVLLLDYDKLRELCEGKDPAPK